MSVSSMIHDQAAVFDVPGPESYAPGICRGAFCFGLFQLATDDPIAAVGLRLEQRLSRCLEYRFAFRAASRCAGDDSAAHREVTPRRRARVMNRERPDPAEDLFRV